MNHKSEIVARGFDLASCQRCHGQDFSGKATEAQPAFIEGLVGVVWAPGGKPRVALRMSISDGRILAIDAVADPDALDSLDLVLLPSS